GHEVAFRPDGAAATGILRARSTATTTSGWRASFVPSQATTRMFDDDRRRAIALPVTTLCRDVDLAARFQTHSRAGPPYGEDLAVAQHILVQHILCRAGDSGQ